MTTKFVLSILLFCTLGLACNNKPKETPAEDSGLIQVTKAQFASENMGLGIPTIQPFSVLVHFTGTIVPSANGCAQISLPIPGIISRIYCQPGQMVSKGALLLEVTGNELIDIQSTFAESAALLVRLKSEYERVKELKSENIGSKKEFVLAESSYLTERAKFNALKIKLENVGLDVTKIEGGSFYPSYSLHAPLSGCVTKINANIGQYTESQKNTAEIIDPQSFLLKLAVFEREISKVKKDQFCEFSLTGEKKVKYKSKLISAGKTIHADTKSVDCYAEIEDLENSPFVSNQFVEGDIYVSTDSVTAVPETAVITLANKSYVIQFEKEAGAHYYFKKAEVLTGRTSNHFTEIKGNLPPGQLLVKGIYNLQIE